MVAHFICLLFTGFVIYTSKPGLNLFSWHPVLLTLAFSFLMVESILLFSPQSSLLSKATRKTKVQCHWISMVLCLTCALLGTAAIWFNKERNGSSHATSYHGIFGFVTVGMCVVQSLAGILIKYPSLGMKISKLSQLKLMHATSGLLTFTLVCITLVLGMFSGWFKAKVTGTSWYVCVACPGMLALIVMNQISSAYLNRHPELRKSIAK